MGKGPGNKSGVCRTVISDINLVKGALKTMGGRRNKRGREAETASASPVKKGGATDKNSSEKKTGEKVWNVKRPQRPG